MKIEKNISDLDDFINGIEDEIVNFIDDRALEAAMRQKVEHDYRNRTYNLESATGYVVTYMGKEKRRFITNPNNSPEANEAINKLLNEVNKAGTGVVFGDGMYYASFVRSKGYDVIDTAELYLLNYLNKGE